MELPRSQSFVNAAIASSRGDLAPEVASDLAQVLAPHAPADYFAPVIVVGGGPSGLRAAQELARRDIPVILFNAERWRPYNRLKLTPFLAGEVQIGVVYQPNLFPVGARVTQYTGQTIVAIDRAGKTVENQFGRRWQYSKLILGLGSHPYVPPIPGRELSGVYRFRNFDDVEQLVARSMRSRRTVVIGGGLLGLEAARGIAFRKVDTVVVEHESHLMARQLDRAAGLMLEEQILAMGIDVRTGCSVKSIAGETRVEGIVLSNGETIECDNVIICTGIRCNIALARDAGIAVGHGITVNDAMQTSDPDVYAVGECAEHDGHIYGLVAPGLEQAAVASGHLAGESVSYRGSVPTTKLKIVGTDVFSMGDIEQVDQRGDVHSVVWQEPAKLVYRRLVLRRGRLIGAMAVGDWPEVARVQQAVRERSYLPFWQLWRMRRTGRLYPLSKPKSAAQWPAAAIVCNCTGVTRGQLGDAMRLGASTAELLMRETNASTVCGTCRPLLHEILGVQAKREPVFGARTIAATSLVAALIALVAVLLPAWPSTSSFERGVGIEQLWLSGTWKQISGFTLLGLSALLAFLSVRKRIGFKWLGDYRFWRIIHTAVGASVLGVLFIHTGFSLGENLNRWLTMTFLGIAAVGSMTGVITAREHAVLASGKASPRVAFVWMHILACWPLPVLLLLHVVTVYAY
jgi:NADPH-dependent 2,4-dienoyl-CoA reductase/sulfur reductase-like enzyme/bacterioferritin-associated ferredoxin